MKSNEIHLRAISHAIPRPLITKISMKMYLSKKIFKSPRGQRVNSFWPSCTRLHPTTPTTGVMVCHLCSLKIANVILYLNLHYWAIENSSFSTYFTQNFYITEECFDEIWERSLELLSLPRVSENQCCRHLPEKKKNAWENVLWFV